MFDGHALDVVLAELAEVGGRPACLTGWTDVCDGRSSWTIRPNCRERHFRRRSQVETVGRIRRTL